MRKCLRKYKYIVIIGILAWFCLISLFTIRIPYDIVSPGYINQVDRVIEIEDGYQSTGNFYTTSVWVREWCSLFQYLIAKSDRRIGVEPSLIGDIYYQHENANVGIYQKNSSIRNSIISGYTAAGYDIKYQHLGRQLIYVLKDHHPSLISGRIIVSISGLTSLLDETEFYQYLYQMYKDEKSVEITFEDGQVEEIQLNKTNTMTLLNSINCFEIDPNSVTPRFIINKTYNQGPSGGLLQALMVYDALTPEDLTKGRKIAGTGTISYDGTVGIIGGIYQKIIAAYTNGADVFLVPDDPENTEGALQAYRDLGEPSSFEIFFVKTLQEAIDYLRGDLREETN